MLESVIDVTTSGLCAFDAYRFRVRKGWKREKRHACQILLLNAVSLSFHLEISML